MFAPRFCLKPFRDALPVCGQMRDWLAVGTGDRIDFGLGISLDLAFSPRCDDLCQFALVSKAFAGIHTERFLEGLCQAFHRPVESDEDCLRLDAVATEPSDDVVVDIVLAKGGFKSGLELGRGSFWQRRRTP